MVIPPETPPEGDRWQTIPGKWGAQFIAAITFYTCLPVPSFWPMNFEGIARYAPFVGIGIGGILAFVDWGLDTLGMPPLTRSALVVALWLWLTGGLHVDGAMDTADGLAVLDPTQRLTVMADSRSGAFGVMAAMVVLGLKTLALSELDNLRWFGLIAAAGWGRWGQVVAIARYPYLKAEGKGAFHKAHAHPATDWLVGFLPLVGFLGIVGIYQSAAILWAVGATVGGCAIAQLTGVWFNGQLGGQTGDTYGAIVEWTEALLLCLMTALQASLMH